MPKSADYGVYADTGSGIAGIGLFLGTCGQKRTRYVLKFAQ